MRVKLSDITDGSYNLAKGTLNFHLNEICTEEDGDNSHINLIINSKSALEIMITLLDSKNLLTKEAEELIDLLRKIEERSLYI